jgi:cysteine-rich repeat protein
MAGDGGAAGATGGAAGAAGSAGQGTTICGKANEETNPKSTSPTCPPGEVIVEVLFASYGLPSGDCGTFKQESCHAAISKARVEQLCLQKNSCKLDAKNEIYGDPCGGKDKRLFVELRCGAPSTTCGDGALDPGEACDGAAVDSPSCAQCSLICAGGFLSNDSRSCYYITANKNWQEDRNECLARGPGCDLAVLDAPGERAFVNGKTPGDLWIGGLRSDSGWQDMPAYHWVDFSPWQGGPAAKWAVSASNGGGPDGAVWTGSEPNNVNTERCVRLKDSDSKLLSATCTDNRVGLCECKVPGAPCNHDGKLDPGEACDDGNLSNGDGCSTACEVECEPQNDAHFTVKDPVSGHCYAVLKQEVSWASSAATCAALGPRYHLARIDSVAEFQFLSVASWSRLTAPGGPGTPPLWFDGNDLGDESIFKTSLGAVLPFENQKFPWATNEPNSIGDEDCTDLRWFPLDGSAAYLLNDSNCLGSAKPLCERE